MNFSFPFHLSNLYNISGYRFITDILRVADIQFVHRYINIYQGLASKCQGLGRGMRQGLGTAE